MKRILFTDELKKEHLKKYNPEKILKEIEREIEEKGFSIFKVDEQKRLEFFYNYSKKLFTIKNQYFIVLIIQIIISGIFSLLFISDGIMSILRSFGIIFTVSSIVHIFLLLTKEQTRIEKSQNITDITGIKDAYIFITNKYIFLNNILYYFDKKKFHTGEKIYNTLFTPSKYYYELDKKNEEKYISGKFSMYNTKQGKVGKLMKKLNLLEEYFEYIQQKYQQIKDEIKKLQNGSFDFRNTNRYIQELQKTIIQIKKEQRYCFKLMGKLGFSRKVNFSKFQQYLQEKLIFSLKSSQYILKNHIFVINELEKQNKHLDSKYIELANTRLQIYKNQLTNHVKLLEQEIEKLKS